MVVAELKMAGNGGGEEHSGGRSSGVDGIDAVVHEGRRRRWLRAPGGALNA